MKNLITLLIVLAGFGLSDLNAQSCCTSQKECKPKICCPSSTACCEDSNSIFGFFTRLFTKENEIEESKSEAADCTATLVVREEKESDLSLKK